jgi:hypothetical protein
MDFIIHYLNMRGKLPVFSKPYHTGQDDLLKQ